MLCIHMYVSVIRGLKKQRSDIRINKRTHPPHSPNKKKNKPNQNKNKTKEQAGFNTQMLIAYMLDNEATFRFNLLVLLVTSGYFGA